jgi:hypothetical protein
VKQGITDVPFQKAQDAIFFVLPYMRQFMPNPPRLGVKFIFGTIDKNCSTKCDRIFAFIPNQPADHFGYFAVFDNPDFL